jgi:undecaprenyl diphosphate synthase
MKSKTKLPQHIAIICDGNRRWAKKKGLPEFSGHKFAVKNTMEELVDHCIKLNIPYLTFWVLSTENWRRGKVWMTQYFKLLRGFFSGNIDKYNQKGARLNLIGDLAQLPSDIQKTLHQWQEKSKANQKITVTIAINYGGRNEIIRAINKLLKAASCQLPADKITEKTFSSYLDTANLPDPDLLIRPGGHQRFSGFMLWQLAYAQLYFTPTLFPDFNTQELDQAISWWQTQTQNLGR